MKRILRAGLGASLVISIPTTAAAQAPSAAQPADATKLAEAHAIIDIMFPPAERQQMMDKMLNDFLIPFRKNLPKAAMADPGLKAIVNEFVDRSLAAQRPLIQRHLPDMLDAMAVAYTHEFSLAELKDIHEFAGTPAGHHYLSKSTAIIGDPAVVKANTAMVADGQALSTAMLPELRDKVVAYIQAHPEVATKLAAENKGK
jgi:hypothetical protein